MSVFLGGDLYFSYVKMYRSMWMGGRYGGGKTALAVATARELVRRHGYRHVVSNIPVSFAANWDWEGRKWRGFDAVEPREVDGFPRLDTVVVLDEGGLFLETKRKVREFVAFLRKLNVVLLLPSVEEPHARLRKVLVERQFNFFRFGVPMWMYRVRTKGHLYRDEFSFLWWRPDVFDQYDTDAVPTDDAGISRWLGRWVDYAIEVYSRRYDIPVHEVSDGGAEDDAPDFADLVAAAEEFSFALSKAPRRRRR